MLGIGADGELLDPAASHAGEDSRDFVTMILDNLKMSGVQQASKKDKIDFTSLNPWPGEMICAEGRYMEGETERRAGIFIGPEFGTVSRQDLVQAAVKPETPPLIFSLRVPSTTKLTPRNSTSWAVSPYSRPG